MASTSVVFDIIAHDRASDKFDKLGNSADRTQSKMSKLGKFGKAAAFALGAGAIFAGKALFDMTRGAIEDEKAQAILAKTLKNAAGATDEKVAAVERWISSVGVATGVTDDELRPALQRLTEATGDVAKAQDLARLAMDISAGTGKSLKTVSEALAKAQMGQVGGLSRYGIATRNAAGEVMSFDQVVAKASKTFAGQAATSANTLEGKMARLQLIFDETKETIGAKLIPVATKLADWFLAEGIPAISSFAGKLKTAAGWVERNSDVLVPLVTVLGGLGVAIGTVVAVTKVWAAVQGVLNAVMAANPLVLVIGLVVGLGVALVVAYKKSETFRAVVTMGMNKVSAAIKAVGAAGRWMWNNALQPVFKFIVSAVGTVLTWFGRMLQLIGKAPKMGWVGDLGDKLVGAGNKADGLANSIRDIPESKSFTLKFNVAYGPGAGAALGIALGGGGSRSVPALASGGIVNRPTLALIGEAGPEAVVPLRGPNARGIGGGAPIIINVSGALDPVAVGQQIEQVLARRFRDTGRPMQFRTI